MFAISKETVMVEKYQPSEALEDLKHSDEDLCTLYELYKAS